MKNHDSFPHMLNGIFGELTKASQIVINYSETSTGAVRHEDSDYRINHVNGFTSPGEFHDYLSSLCAEVRRNILEAVKELEQAEQSFFFMEANNRVWGFSSNVFLAYLPNACPEKNATPGNLIYLFKNPVLTGDNNPPGNCSNEVLIFREASEYAQRWKASMKTLQYQLICLLTGAEYFPTQGTQTGTPPGFRNKLPLKTTVAVVAAFIRLLYEAEIFDTTNKSQICRIIASLFQTPNQGEVSSKSFRNLFNSPAPDALSQLEEALMRWRDNAQRLSDLN